MAILNIIKRTINLIEPSLRYSRSKVLRFFRHPVSTVIYTLYRAQGQAKELPTAIACEKVWKHLLNVSFTKMNLKTKTFLPQYFAGRHGPQEQGRVFRQIGGSRVDLVHVRDIEHSLQVDGVFIHMSYVYTIFKAKLQKKAVSSEPIILNFWQKMPNFWRGRFTVSEQVPQGSWEAKQ